jgi:dihydrofolate reductase
MGKLTITSFITLDNIVEDPHLWSMQFQSDDTGEVNDEALKEADALLLGRVTYDGFAAAWPSRSGDPYSDKFNAMPKYVVSTSLDRADWNNSTIIRDDVVDRVRALKEDQNLLVWGNPTLVKVLIENDLVDDYLLLVSPIVRVNGKKLFRESGEQHDLRITESKLLSGGMLALRMTPANA